MSDVTRIPSQIESGDPSAAELLLPLVYDELRKLAAFKLAQEKPGQTLQATALVHDAYIRLVDVEKAQHWNSRGHFFGAAAEAMRRILIESARRKSGPQAGGAHGRVELSEAAAEVKGPDLDVIALSEALDRLQVKDPRAAELVKLRFFCWTNPASGGRMPRHFRRNRRQRLGLRQRVAQGGTCESVRLLMMNRTFLRIC